MTSLLDIADPASPRSSAPGGWVAVCSLDKLRPDLGIAALIGGQPVAVFRLSGSEEVLAIGNIDPFAGASVLSRGLVGAIRIDGRWVTYVASPLRKQRFDLHTGQCLDDPEVQVGSFRTKVERGVVFVHRQPRLGLGESPNRNRAETRS